MNTTYLPVSHKAVGAIGLVLSTWLCLVAGVPLHVLGVEGPPVAPDAAVIDLDLPADAAVAIDGRDYAGQRQFTFQSLRPEVSYLSKLSVRFASGRTEERELLLLQGRRVRCTLRDPQRVGAKPELLVQNGHNGGVSSIQFSGDGRLMLTAREPRVDDGEAFLWDVATGRKLREFADHYGTLSPDGQWVLSFRVPDAIFVRDAATGRVLHQFRPAAETNGLCGVHFRTNKREAVISAEEGPALYDVAAGRQLRAFPLDGGRAHASALAPDGNRLLVSDGTPTGESCTLAEYDVDRGQRLRTFEGKPLVVKAMAYSPDGNLLATSGHNAATAQHELLLWNVRTGAKLRSLATKYAVESVAFSRDGRQLVTAGRQVAVWDVDSGEPLHSLRMTVSDQGNPRETFKTAVFGPEGRRVYVGVEKLAGSTGAIKVWEPVSKRDWNPNPPALDRIAEIETSHRFSTGVAFSPDGRLFATISSEEGPGLILRETAGAQPLQTIPFSAADADSSALPKLSFSRDGRKLLAYGCETKDGKRSGDYKSVLLDVATGQILRTIADSGAGVLSPDGSVALTTSGPVGQDPDGNETGPAVFLCDATTGRRLHALQGIRRSVMEAAFSADSRSVVTVGGEFQGTEPFDEVTLWDVKTGSRLREFKGHGSRVHTVAFSPDDRRLLTGGPDVRLWDVASGREIRRLVSKKYLPEGVSPGFCYRIRFSPDGHSALASYGGGPQGVVLWNLESATEIRNFPATEGEFAASGTQVLARDEHNALRIWKLATGDEEGRLFTFDRGHQWLVTSPEGLFDGSAGGRRGVTYRIGGQLNVVPVDRFFQDCFRPGLLGEILASAGPQPAAPLGGTRPPLVKIVSPAAGTVDAAKVTIDVEITDQGGGISGPWLRQNGARVLAAGETRQQGAVRKRSFSVSLVEGRNLLQIEAASGDGSWESEPAQFVLTFERAMEKPDLYVIAVGINRYAEKSMKLEFAARDAEAMAAVFRDRGETLYRKVSVASLIDGQATKANLEKAFAQAAASAQARDALVVSLSGHGFALGQRYYFIPCDFRNTAGSLQEDIRRSGLPNDLLGEWMSSVPTLKRVLILDTCNSGAAVGRTGRSRNPFAFRGSIERLVRAQGIYTIAASSSSEDAMEVPALKHGVLTYTLLAGLQAVDHGPLADTWIQPNSPDRVVGILEWFGFASGHVPRLTQQLSNHAQEVQASSEGASFPVLPIKAR